MVEPATRRQLDDATASLDTPCAVLDRAVLHLNADDLVRRASGKPIRLASKSIRCRKVMREVLDRPGFAGILGYTVAEALWLADEFDDIVVGYPSVETCCVDPARNQRPRRPRDADGGSHRAVGFHRCGDPAR